MVTRKHEHIAPTELDSEELNSRDDFALQPQRPDIVPWRNTGWWRRPPAFIMSLLAIDLAFSFAYVVTRRLREDVVPFEWVMLFDLDVESNIPSWWSTVQLMLVGMLLLNFAGNQRRNGRGATWAIIAAVGFMFLSLDENVALHERLAVVIGDYVKVFALATAVPLLLGVIAICFLAWEDISRDPRVRTLIFVGFGVYILGFAVVDELGEFIERDTLLWRIEVLTEETLEMVGVTILAWAAWLLSAVHRLRPS